MIIYNKPFETKMAIEDDDCYHSQDMFLSSSMIKDFLESPKFFKEMYFKERKVTPSMEFGKLVHEATLEPEKFSRRSVIPEFGDLRIKNNKEAKQKFFDSQLPGPSIAKDNSDKIKKILNNLEDNEFYHLLDNTQREKSIYAWDYQHQMGLKARPDAFNEHSLIDIKTIKGISDDTKTEYYIRNMHYHIQLSFYQRALNLAGYDPTDFYILFIENEEPFDTKFVQLDPHFMRYTFLELDKILADFKYCDKNNYWPGKQEKIIPLLFRSLS